MNKQQALASLQAYLPDDAEIVKIINLCDLEPENDTTSGWRVWVNEYYPTLKVQKNKKVVIRKKHTDPFAEKKDLYAFSNVRDVAKISKALLFIAEDAKHSKDCFCFLFWGKDGRLRYRRCINGMFFSDPPLSLPLEDVRSLVKNENIDGHKKIQCAKKSGIGWVTSWPPKKEFYQEIVKETKVCNSPAESLILDFCDM